MQQTQKNLHNFSKPENKSRSYDAMLDSLIPYCFLTTTLSNLSGQLKQWAPRDGKWIVSLWLLNKIF
jgi:hypothetical protein